MQRLRRSGQGHLYFELIEKGRADDIVAKLEAVIWRSDFERVDRLLADHDQRLVQGVEIRCLGAADFYPPFGRLQLAVRRVDPDFTAGLLSRRRRETIATLRAGGLLEKNKGLDLDEVPLEVVLISSAGSAAYHDFISGLERSGYGFRVAFIHSAVQGPQAESELASALERAESLMKECIVLVRGGGSRTDMAVFDSRRVAEGVALAGVPVITGVGHEIDEAVCDLVAHTRTKTPTEAAEFLISRVRDADRQLAEIGEVLARETPGLLSRGRAHAAKIERELAAARYRVAAEAKRVQALALRLGSGAKARTRAAGSECAASGAQLLALSSVRLRQERRRSQRYRIDLEKRVRDQMARSSTQLVSLERLSRQLSPGRILRRGFSITRTANGKALRSNQQVSPGTVLETQLAEGSVVSRVETP